MKTHIVTKDQLDAENRYIGTTSLVDFEGHIEIEIDLGCVIFTTLKAAGRIFAKAGSGIEAGDGIEAVKTISVRLRIFAGLVTWRLPELDELKVTCSKLVSGTVAFGELVETSREAK